MIESDVIIIGGGPAGSTCAWYLQKHGVHAIVLDKAQFPRDKLCAGWITPRVFRILRLGEEGYPYTLTTFNRIEVSFFGISFPVRTTQHAIRRVEFDDWLLRRSGVPVHHHHAREISIRPGGFVIDSMFRCRFLVGAGGTNCPVYRTLFEPLAPRRPERLIVALEEEFPCERIDQICRLWFFENRLPGYAWYVPKGNEYVNVGIGAKFMSVRTRGINIRDHWHAFMEKLSRHSLISRHPGAPRGYAYYLNQPHLLSKKENAFVVGDSAGLASVDMGEGIGPAVESGILVARSIITGEPYRPGTIGRFSAVDLLVPGVRLRRSI